MKLSDFLATQAQTLGSDKLTGSMIFVNLDRPLDQVIRHALALGQFHPGQPSPWSHCFLIAEPYKDGSTQILDCTIRDSNNKILWDSNLAQDIEVLTQGLAGKEGKIYTGRVDDYDHPKVLESGIYYLPNITLGQRNQIVTAARQLQSDGYRYDLPGLVRELIRLLIGASIKQTGPKLLFCSAFLATSYRIALGNAWNVVPQVAAVDVTPDEIWFSPPGSKFRSH